MLYSLYTQLNQQFLLIYIIIEIWKDMNARDSHSVFDALISQCWTYERMMRARMIYILMISSQMDRASDSFVGDYGKFLTSAEQLSL